MVTNGENIQSGGVCKGMEIIIANIIFILDLYTWLLCGANVVLGVNWLKSLGVIDWDFQMI